MLIGGGCMNKKDINEFLEFRKKFSKLEWFEINQAVNFRENEKANQIKLDDSDIEIISERLIEKGI